MPIPGLKDTEDWGISGLSPPPQDRQDREESNREAEAARAIAIGAGDGYDDVASLPVSSYYGGPPSIRDTARAATTVTEATFDSPRNYTQETAEWPGGKQ